MTTTIQQDALLSRLSVLAYDDPATVRSKLRDDPSLTGWSLYDGTPPRIEGNFAAYAFKGPNGEVVSKRLTRPPMPKS